MFDIGFSELVLTALIALVVFGPERLPQAARTAGLWIGRIKRVLTDTRREIERELGADDIRRQLHNESIMKVLNETPQAIQRTVQETVQLASDSVSHANTVSHTNTALHTNAAPQTNPAPAASAAPTDNNKTD